MQAAVSCGLSHVSVMARMSIFFENKCRLNQTFVVANLMLRLMAGPRLILTSPDRRSIMANLNVSLEQDIGSNLRLNKGEDMANHILCIVMTKKGTRCDFLQFCFGQKTNTLLHR